MKEVEMKSGIDAFGAKAMIQIAVQRHTLKRCSRNA